MEGGGSSEWERLEVDLLKFAERGGSEWVLYSCIIIAKLVES